MPEQQEIDKAFEDALFADLMDDNEEATALEGEEVTDIQEEEEQEGMDAQAEGDDQEAEAIEGKGEDQEDEEKDTTEPKRVPLAELIEERRKRQELEAKLNEQEGRMGRYDELFARLEAQEKAAAEKAEQEAIPDADTDPVGNLRYQQAKQEEELAKTREAMEKQSQQTEQREFMRTVSERVQTAEKSFVSENPDYYEALGHVRKVLRMQAEPMLRARGITDDAQIAQAMGIQEAQAAMQLVQAGINPAEYTYNYAKTIGWQPQANDGEPGDQGDETEETNTEDDLERQERGLKAAKGGKSSGGGKAPSREFVDSATPEEFEAAMQEMFPK